jgi:branched-chain amino acid transport system substrate-binding protein
MQRALPHAILLSGLSLLALLNAAPICPAQTPGVSDKEIVIGSCAALEGPSSFLGRETVAGAQTYFHYINDEGGVNGRKLRLVSFDDSYDPAKTRQRWDKLMAEKVFAAGFFVGTPTAVKYVPLAESEHVPLVGLFTGAQTLRAPLRHWVINVRASYGDETHAEVEGLWNVLHYRKIAVIYPDDAFGATVLEGVRNALKAHGAEPVETASYVRQTTQAGDAVVVVGPSNTVAPIVKTAHSKGWKPLFLTVSFVGTDELIQQAGADAEGMVITQVVPPYYLSNLKTGALYRRTLQQYMPGARPNFVSLESFVDAMVLVDGLKNAGKEPTREGLIRAIESSHDMDLGLGPQLRLDYSPKNHKGFEHVIPTVVRGGTAVPFTDWNIVLQK